jgi:NAD(P)-dependent dehydrogenase (short-subunit alcohol dehydrogenase family)
MPPERFSGRTALVTGAASGIGRATAIRLASEGATVVAVDVNADLLSKLSGETGGLSGSVSTLVGDVGTEDGVDRLVSEAVDRLGTLDVVVNVAGVLSFSHTHEQPLEEWSRLIAINLTGTFLVCRQALPHLLSSHGNIVNLASTAAHKGQPWAAAYAASKGGVLAFTRALAVEYAAAGLRVNSISPGAIDTPITSAVHLPEGADIKL